MDAMQSLRRRRGLGALSAALVTATAGFAGPAGAAPAPRCAPSVERVEHGTWAMTPIRGIEGAYPGWRMATDPTERSLVVVADSAGVLVSRDGGCRWRRALKFDDVAPEWSLRAVDVEVAHGPRGRSLHVATLAAGNARVVLASSEDDGRTWSLTEPPAEATALVNKVRLSADPGRGLLYLHVQNNTTTGSVLTTEDSGDTWRWTTLTTFGGPTGACLPPGACTGPPLVQVEAGAGGIWARAAGSVNEDERIVESRDAGSSWSDVPVPALGGGPALLDVATSRTGRPAVLLLGSFGEYALSRDGGSSWGVGEVPSISSGPYTTSSFYDAAHTLGGRAFAALSGDGPGLWSGNVMLFDGREWNNVAPEAYAGFDRKDGDGRPLFFTELAGNPESFSMLSSRGLLATFRPGR
jgi:photosystem II stability/assembly factor-like uncharacterized protein